MNKLLLLLIMTTMVTIEVTNPCEHGHHHHGRSYGDIRPRIYGGEETEKHEFPFLVNILVNGKFTCGGSLIAEDVVLTAAHCMGRSPQSYMVVAGDHDRTTMEGPEQTRTVMMYTRHEEFAENPTRNDVAVLLVSPKFDIGKEISTVSLAPSGFTPTPIAISMGWGKTERGSTSPVPRKLVVPRINPRTCLRILGRLPDGTLCYGGERTTGTCVGDSGGPLMCGAFQCGIVSYIVGECANGLPDVYADVSLYADWIKAEADKFVRP